MCVWCVCVYVCVFVIVCLSCVCVAGGGGLSEWWEVVGVGVAVRV